MPFYIALIPALCDVGGMSANLVGMSLVSGSIYMMVRGSILVFVVIYSIIILRKIYSRHHWLGVFLIIVGVVFVGWGGI